MTTYFELACDWGLLSNWVKAKCFLNNVKIQIISEKAVLYVNIFGLVCERTAVMQDVLWGNTKLEEITFYADNGRLRKVSKYSLFLSSEKVSIENSFSIFSIFSLTFFIPLFSFNVELH